MFILSSSPDVLPPASRSTRPSVTSDLVTNNSAPPSPRKDSQPPPLTPDAFTRPYATSKTSITSTVEHIASPNSPLGIYDSQPPPYQPCYYI